MGRGMKAEETKMPERMRQLAERMMEMTREIMATTVMEEHEDFKREVACKMEGAQQELHRLAAVMEGE